MQWNANRDVAVLTVPYPTGYRIPWHAISHALCCYVERNQAGGKGSREKEENDIVVDVVQEKKKKAWDRAQRNGRPWCAPARAATLTPTTVDLSS